MRVSLYAQIEELANRGPFRPQFTATFLSEILDAAIEGTDADMGNIQIYDPQTGSLHIQVHRGFHEPFLEFFNSVDPGHAACGTALQSRERVIVPDVSDSTVFSGPTSWKSCWMPASALSSPHRSSANWDKSGACSRLTIGP